MDVENFFANFDSTSEAVKKHYNSIMQYTKVGGVARKILIWKIDNIIVETSGCSRCLGEKNHNDKESFRVFFSQKVAQIVLKFIVNRGNLFY